MTRKTVTVAAKPQAVPALRRTWRKTAEQRVAQLWRFVRLYVFTFAGQVLIQVVSTAVAGGVDITKLDQKALAALLVPAAEVVWRQKHPALTASAVDTAPGATLVPDQLPDAPAAADGPAD